MTIDAMILLIVRHYIILIYGTDFKISQITLIKSQSAVRNITGFDQTVRQETVYGLSCHIQFIRCQTLPVSISLHIKTDCQTVSCITCRKITPGIRFKHYLAVCTSTDNKRIMPSAHFGYTLPTGIKNTEIQRGYIHRTGHIGIIRKQLRFL